VPDYEKSMILRAACECSWECLQKRVWQGEWTAWSELRMQEYKQQRP
jgi:hypothetical protein